METDSQQGLRRDLPNSIKSQGIVLVRFPHKATLCEHTYKASELESSNGWVEAPRQLSVCLAQEKIIVATGYAWVLSEKQKARLCSHERLWAAHHCGAGLLKEWFGPRSSGL